MRVLESLISALLYLAIISMPTVGALTYYHYVMMERAGDELEKIYIDGGGSPQSVALDPEVAFLCSEKVRVMSERGYIVELNGFRVKRQSIETEGICSTPSQTLRYWKLQQDSPKLQG